MGRIFTLHREASDALEHLNEKMFKIKIDKHSQRMAIVDATNGKILRLSTPIVSKVETTGGCIITTKSGQVYDLVDVAILLPTRKHKIDTLMAASIKAKENNGLRCVVDSMPAGITASDLSKAVGDIGPGKDINDILAPILEPTEPKSEEKSEEKIVDPIKEISVFRHINYGDGYQGTVYEFPEMISYDAFLKFLIEKGENLDKLKNHAWYEDYPKIIKGSMNSGVRHNSFQDATPNDTAYVWTYIVVKPYTD